MAFSKREYKIYKKWMDDQLKHGCYMNPEIYTSLKDREDGGRFAFIEATLGLLSQMIHVENYEACQTIYDSLRDLFASKGYPFPENAVLNIKAPNLEPLHCHVSYVRCKMSGL